VRRDTEAVNEGPVDLENVYGELFEVTERRVAVPEDFTPLTRDNRILTYTSRAIYRRSCCKLDPTVRCQPGDQVSRPDEVEQAGDDSPVVETMTCKRRLHVFG
jgi:hypothetical protein